MQMLNCRDFAFGPFLESSALPKLRLVKSCTRFLATAPHTPLTACVRRTTTYALGRSIRCYYTVEREGGKECDKDTHEPPVPIQLRPTKIASTLRHACIHGQGSNAAILFFSFRPPPVTRPASPTLLRRLNTLPRSLLDILIASIGMSISLGRTHPPAPYRVRSRYLSTNKSLLMKRGPPIRRCRLHPPPALPAGLLPQNVLELTTAKGRHFVVATLSKPRRSCPAAPIL